MTVGEKIKMLREQNNLSQSELASKVLVTPAYIVHIEKNQKMPGLQTTALLANVLGCSVDYLTEDFVKAFKNN